MHALRRIYLLLKPSSASRALTSVASRYRSWLHRSTHRYITAEWERATPSPSAAPSAKGSSPRADQPWQSAAHASHFRRRECTVFASTRSSSLGALAAHSALRAERRPRVRDFAPDHATSERRGAPGRADRRDFIARPPVENGFASGKQPHSTAKQQARLPPPRRGILCATAYAEQ